MNVFDEMGKYWREIADEHQTTEQIKFIQDTIKIDGFVLDLACGTGRHAILLSKRGYHMVGLDISAKLLKMAKDRWRESDFVMADLRFLPFKQETFASAISMDSSMGYLPSENDDLKSLIETHKVVINYGAFIIDVFNPEHLISKYAQKRSLNLKWKFLPILSARCNNRLSRWVLLRAYKWKEYPSFYLLQKRTVDTHAELLQDLWIVYDKDEKKVNYSPLPRRASTSNSC